NGNAATQQNLGTFTPQTSSHFYIGYRSSGTAAGNKFNGIIDELSLYNRALNGSEIQSIFAAGSAGKCKPPLPSISYDIQRDYSTNQNPAGVWSYGWKNTLVGAFNRYQYSL